MIRACATVDGEARAAWKLEKRPKGARLAVSPYETLNAAELAQLELEAQSLGRFLNAKLELRIADA